MAVVHTRNRKRLHEEVKNFVLECDICERQFPNTSQLSRIYQSVLGVPRQVPGPGPNDQPMLQCEFDPQDKTY